MNIEDIIKSWKADEGALDTQAPISPVGDELSDEELLEVAGGMMCADSWRLVTCTTITGVMGE
jgi:hypothetical protein